MGMHKNNKVYFEPMSYDQLDIAAKFHSDYNLLSFIWKQYTGKCSSKYTNRYLQPHTCACVCKEYIYPYCIIPN
uniref:Uncharacterized protein n=1 Tax=Octopus bimaculoides TaxID=37653 RepID=A0A0L8HGJ5_OCTBM